MRAHSDAGFPRTVRVNRTCRHCGFIPWVLAMLLGAVAPNARATTAEGEPRRIGLYRQAEERIVRDAPWIFLFHMNDDHLRQPWIRGYRHRPIWPNARLDACWIER